MANTNFIKIEVEPYVREQLSTEYECSFKPTPVHLNLCTSGKHEFDAVSEDRNIVASIKSHAGKTKSGKRATASYLACIAELYFLSLVKGRIRMLVLTDPEMYLLIENNILKKGRLAPGLTIKHIKLSEELQTKMAKFRPSARAEVSPLLPVDEVV